MSAGVLAPVEARPVPTLPHLLPSVQVSVSVATDRQRLFQMLTVAEYMEAWLAVPDLSTDSHVTVTSAPDCFRIDHFRSRQADFSITAQYRMCRRGKIQFSWRKDCGHGSASSLVLIRLCGDFGRTTVVLRHTLLSSSEQAWHQDLWENSLRKLQLLF
jgi:uncharacterized protein YndB with AHSA1/START domain